MGEAELEEHLSIVQALLDASPEKEIRHYIRVGMAECFPNTTSQLIWNYGKKLRGIFRSVRSSKVFRTLSSSIPARRFG
jgi:hypothetical protein